MRFLKSRCLAAIAVGLLIASASGLLASAAHAQPASGMVTERVSVSSNGAQGDGPSYVQSPGQLVSADGRFVVFNSLATNFTANDNAGRDVFVRDRVAGTTELVSVKLAGGSAGYSGEQAISANGKTVAFGSLSSQLVATPVPAWVFQLYVRDLVSGRTELVSVDSAGIPGNADSENPNLSADGRFVVFSSLATNLASGSRSGVRQVYLHDRATGVTERMSIDGQGVAGNGNSDRPMVSDDGQVVAFDSRATNFLASDRNGAYEDVFVRDRRTGTTELASVSPKGNQSGFSWIPSLSSDGLTVAWESNGPDSCTTAMCVFVRNRTTATTVHASVSSAGEPAAGSSGGARLSADARFVAFYSDAGNLDAGDENRDYDVFVRDLHAGTTRLASRADSGAQGDARSYNPSLSADGRTVAFESWASTLIPDDTNAAADVFVRATTAEPSAAEEGEGTIRDWGYANLFRAEADVNADGLVDYCRFVGDEPNVFFSCQLRRADGRYGADYGFDSQPGIDRGQPNFASSLADENGDSRADYCRYLGRSGYGYTYRACAFAEGNGFATGKVDSEPGQTIRDWGYAHLLRAEADVNGDGLADYCRFVGDEPNVFLSCQLLRSDGLYGDDYGFNSLPGVDRGVPDRPSEMIDNNGDGRVDYCRWVYWPAPNTYKTCIYAGPEGFSTDQYLQIPGTPDVPVARVAPYREIRGTLMCLQRNGNGYEPHPLAQVPVEITDFGTVETRNDGSFLYMERGDTPPPNYVQIKVRYKGKIWGDRSGATAGVGTPLEVMDDLHNARSEERVVAGKVLSRSLHLGTIYLQSPDCDIWVFGAEALQDYQQVTGEPHPAGELRIKRWSNVVTGGVMAYFDHITIPRNFADIERWQWLAPRRETFFHEFAHTFRHVHSTGDSFDAWVDDSYRFTYGNHWTIANMGEAFNEGWANYWDRSRARLQTEEWWKHNDRLEPSSPEIEWKFLDWNEYRVADRLLALSSSVGYMMARPGEAFEAAGNRIFLQVLKENPRKIYSLYDFEMKLFELLGPERSEPLRLSRSPGSRGEPPSSCPPGYDEHFDSCSNSSTHRVIVRTTYSRGVGVPISSCPEGEEEHAGICYQPCRSGYEASGAICYQICPEGYTDDGVTCRNGWHIFGQDSYWRTGPLTCEAGLVYDNGLCYEPCLDHYEGRGPGCWF